MQCSQSIRRAGQVGVVLTLLWARTAPVLAQASTASPDPNPGNLSLTGSLDAVSTYMFRGIRQHTTGMALWPTAEVDAAIYAGKGNLRSVGVNVGTWNSLHTGDTGIDGPTGKLWYESDFYAMLALAIGPRTTVNSSFTAITSPNSTFTTVKEIDFKVSIDDSSYLGRASLKPYGFVVFEVDTSPGVGQADGGSKAGRYLELGIAPGYARSRASLNVPIKLGLSLANYYELNTGTVDAPVFVDHHFGYFSVAGVLTAPLAKTTRFGAWNLHGGIEFQTLGETTRTLNGGDRHKVIMSGGIGFSY